MITNKSKAEADYHDLRNLIIYQAFKIVGLRQKEIAIALNLSEKRVKEIVGEERKKQINRLGAK